MTQKTRFIQFRVTREQYERIYNNSRGRGYHHLSLYLRDLALNKDDTFQRKLDEIHKAVVKGENKAKNGK